MNARFALLTAFALTASACSCHGKLGDIHPARELVEYRPKSPSSAIRAVSLSSSDTIVFDEHRVGTSLPAGSKHAVVWFQWEDAKTPGPVVIRWYKGQQLVMEQQQPLTPANGEAGWVLMSSSGGPLPAGSYHVDLVENGQVATSIPFTVAG